MSIKSDRWIRRMSEQHGMIEPFEAGQVKQANGERIVSYGTSSYGYDVRCSREFKVFTNINSTIVDPKHFDSGSFVDITADECIIPPNSFALARTVEYFRIPRDTLVENTRYFREKMVAAGFDVKPGVHPISPVMLYDAPLAQKFAERLLEEGIYAIGFFFPVVPKGQARIRTQISAAHSREHLDRAIDAFTRIGVELGVIKG